MRRKDYAEAARRFQAAIDLDARAVPAYLNLGDVRVARGQREGGGARSGRSSCRWRPIAPTWRSIGSRRWPSRTGHAGALHAALPAADRREPAGLARAAGAVAPPGGERAAARGARPAVRRARAESARAQHPSGDLARARAAAPSRRRSSIATASSPSTPCSTSIRTSACAAAIAAPSCSGSARTATTGTRSSKSGSRPRRTRRKSKSRRETHLELQLRQIGSTCASVSSNVPSVRMTKSARAAFSSAGICAARRWRASASVRPRASSRASCVGRRADRRDRRGRSRRLPAGLVQQRDVDDGERRSPISSNARRPAAIAR